MIENNRLYLKSGDRLKARLAAGAASVQWASTVGKLKNITKEKVSQSVLSNAIQFYKQNQLFSIAGLLLLFLIFMVLVLAASADKSGTNTMRHSHDGYSDNQSQGGNDVVFTPQDAYTKIKYNLEIIALSIVQGDKWNKQHIVDFAYSWNELNAGQKAKVKQTVWFQLLENALVQILSKEHRASGFKNERTKLLAILSDKLDINVPNEPQLFASNVDAPSKKDETSHQTTPDTTEAFHNSDDSAAPAPARSIETLESQAKELAKLEKELFLQVKAKQNTPSVPPSLIQADKPNSEKPEPAHTEMAAAEVTTAAPSVANSQLPELLPLQQSSGTSDNGTDAQSHPTVHKIIRTPPAADAVDLNTRLAANSNSANSAALNNGPISDAALKKLTTQLVNSYEKGNINSFASLFAPNAVSNDEADLKSIKKDYASLFATTSDRRMIIGDIKWNFSNNTATGDGKMEVTVKANGANQTQKYAGKIQIVVKKQRDGVQITKLFHDLK